MINTKDMLSIKEYYEKNYGMINEAFQCKLLSELNKQFNLRIYNNKEDNEWAGSFGKDIKSTFKRIFSYWDIKWNEITEDRITKCSSTDNNAIKKVERMLSNRSNSFPGMVILTNNGSNWPKYTGALIKVLGDIRYYSFITNSEFRADSKKLNEVRGYLTETFYIIDLSNLSARDIQRDRMKSRDDSIYYTDKESRDDAYKKILNDNKRRYKEYTEKIKAQKQANDGVPEKVEEYMGKITKLLESMSKDPIKYAKFEYDIYHIMRLLNGKREWHQPRSYKENGYYSGLDGLLVVYESYIKNKLALARGSGSDSDAKAVKEAKSKLENLYTVIDKKLEEINTKMAA